MDGISSLSPELQRAFQMAVQADRKPVERLNEQKGKLDARVQLFTDVIGKIDAVKGLIPNLNSPIAIRELAVTSSNDKALSATADKNIAQPGSFNIEVDRLATPASAISNGLPDKDSTRVGSGYFTFTTASGDTKDVFIDDTNGTLDGVAKTINNAGIGVKAGVVNDQSDPENPWRLVLTAEGTGEGNNVTYPEFYFVDGESEFFIERETPAENALIRFEGQEIESPTNEIKGLIAGVTLNLKGLTEPGNPGTLSIGQDIPKTTVKVKDLVDKLNSVFTFFQNQNKMDEKTDTSKTLGGDFGIRIAEQRLKNALYQPLLSDPNRRIRSLNDVGIQFTKGGTLTFDEKKFESKLNDNFDEVVSYLAGDGVASGIIPALSRALGSISATPDGILTSEKKTETDKITRIDKQVADKEKVSERKAADLKQKLGRAQAAITTMQRQSSQIAASSGGLGGIPNALLGQ
jgi:flagellar hook-associated protein 2